ncbi:MAG: hypothetical protein MI923_19470 [Phycisphaerales bacterium]|nr:hypothetical protein [Phycisphaerales bacterium]
MQTNPTTTEAIALPGLTLLIRLKLRLLRNRLRQLTDQSPLQLLMVIVFVGTIWGGLYVIFDHVFVYLRRFEYEAIIAIPYVFHVFFLAMTLLLAFSTAVLVYGALFAREEPAFLLSAPNEPRNVVAIMYIESLFFSSWSLVLLGLPLMLAIGQVQGLPWHFYPIFMIAFLGFVPIPGAFGLMAALAVALYLPRLAKRSVFYGTCVILALVIIWWGRIWAISSTTATTQWLNKILGELQYLKAALLPSSWVSKAIQFSIEDKPSDATFYLCITVCTAMFLSWWATMIVSRKLLPAFGRAQAAPNKMRRYSGWASQWLTRIAFFYLPLKMRVLILKDLRNFFRDPIQWSQLAILFGLLSLYLFYLPRSRPDGFSMQWKALICFLNYGAITLILSTFTSRFVFPMISMEGQQSWLVGLWPMSRSKVIWAKFLFALTVTATAALSVSYLSIRALELPPVLAAMQASATFATCLGLCGLAIGLGAKLPNYDEPNASRIASGLGGTVNLIASVALVAMSVALFGAICWYLVQSGRLDRLTVNAAAAFVLLICLSLLTMTAAINVGIRQFRKQQF